MASTVDPAPFAPPPADALRALHARLATAARELELPVFLRRYAAELHEVLTSDGVEVRLVDGRRRTVCAAQAGPPAAGDAFRRAMDDVVRDGLGTFLPAEGGDAGRHAAARQAALLYPIRLGTTVRGAVLVRLPDGVPRAAAAALGRVIVPLCDFAAEAIYRSERTTPASSDDAFALALQSKLDVRRTAETIACEVARLTECDRAAVCVVRRGRAVPAAFSGQDDFDPRAALVRRYAELCAAVARSGEQLEFPVAQSGAPQLEAALQTYLDEAHARRLLAVPLVDADGATIGVLTLERLAAADDDDVLHLPAAAAAHAAAALDRALRHEATSLGPLARIPAAVRLLTTARNLPRTAAVAALLAGFVAALVFVPYEYEVEARGTLQPVVRRDVFAPQDGTVDRIFVRTGDRTALGDPLVELRSRDLDFAEAELIKQINETEQELLNAEREYNQGRTVSAEERQRLPGRIAVLEQRRDNLRRESLLLAEKRKQLRIVSPLAGVVTTWNVVELLAERPVRQGQTLMSLVDPASEWELEIRLPEDRLGSVLTAQRTLKEDLHADFMPAAEPGRRYEARVRETALAAEPHGDEGNVVVLKASLDKRQLTQLQPGSDVRVRIRCGTRPLGAVLLGDVWAFVQSQILFRL